MKLKLKEEPKEWLKFTAACALLIFILGFVLQRRHALPGRLWMILLICALPVLACWMRPRWFRGFYRGGMRVSFWMGQWVGKFLLLMVFVAVVLPLGWLLRAFGKDLLNLKRQPDASSYWRPAKQDNQFDRLF